MSEKKPKKPDEEVTEPKKDAVAEKTEAEKSPKVEEKPKPKTGPGQIVKGVVDTAFSIIKFDFLKKSR